MEIRGLAKGHKVMIRPGLETANIIDYESTALTTTLSITSVSVSVTISFCFRNHNLQFFLYLFINSLHYMERKAHIGLRKFDEFDGQIQPAETPDQ